MFHPANAPDILTFLREYGTAWLVLLSLVCLILWLAYRYVRHWMRKIAEYFERMHSGICKLENTWAGDTWRDCPLERCGPLKPIADGLADLREKLIALHQEAREDRAETREAIHIVMRRFDDFASHAIAALRKNGGGR